MFVARHETNVATIFNHIECDPHSVVGNLCMQSECLCDLNMRVCVRMHACVQKMSTDVCVKMVLN